jgi:hypothetical protein
MVQRLRITTLIAVLIVPGTLQVASGQSFRPAFPGSPTDVVNFVEEAFFNTHSVGSLVTGGTCNPADATTDVVSDDLSHPPAGPFQSIDEAITALSRIDPRVSWTRGPDGMLRVRDGNVPDDVLGIRLRRVQFKNRAQPGFAIQDILSTPEVQAYFKEHHIEEGLYARMGDLGLLPGNTKGLPRLSTTLRNVTVEEALDHVAQFFHKLWIYSDCANGPRRLVVVTAY